MTADSIRAAYKAIFPASEKAGLLAAALSRAESDWLVGINGSRALGQFLRKTTGEAKTSSVGRVQTPTLALIVHRELAIKNFVPTPYFEVHGTFQVKTGEYLGRWQNQAQSEADNASGDSRTEDNKSRLSTMAAAQAVIDRCQANAHKGVVVTEESKPSLKNPPALFDLTTLQREANKRFGYTAADTLKIAQALYETHKVTSYPRTDSSALPEDYVETANKILKSFAGTAYENHTKPILENAWLQKNASNKKIFNNEKISDHFAIIPTGQTSANLNESEATIYNLIVRRFIAIFYPAAEYLKTTRISAIASDTFVSSGTVLKAPGWLHVYGNVADADAEPNLAALEPNETVGLNKVEAKALKTRPPAYYNEASLLGVMEKASGEIIDDDDAKKAMSEKGLGTPATRAATIEGLVAKEYIERKGKEIRPTERALFLISVLEKLGLTLLTSAKTTGEWEHKLALMDKGQYQREAFMRDITDTTRLIVATFAGHAANSRAAHPCPDCGNALIRRESTFKKGEFYWSCSGYPKCTTTTTDDNGKPGQKKVPVIASTEHLCPKCGKGLVKRSGISKKTAKPYVMWSCSGFPKCKEKPLADVGGAPVFNAKDLD